MRFKYIIIIIVIQLILTNLSFSKECESELNGNLIKVSESDSLNAEIVVSANINNETYAFKAYFMPMLNFAYQHTFSDTFLFFTNVGIKFKTYSEEEESPIYNTNSSGGRFSIVKPALRELYFSSFTQDYQLKFGFLTTSLNEQLLLDERGAGFDFNYKTEHLNFRVFGSAVINAFSKEGKMCISKSKFVATEFPDGESSAWNVQRYFYAVSFEFIFGSRPAVQQNPDSNSEDEFQETTPENVNTKPFKFDLTYFSEYYSDIDKFKHFLGIHSANTILGLDYAIEGAFQFYRGDVAFGYIIRLSDTFIFGNGQKLKVFAGYTGYHKISGSSPFMPVSSNLFLSERMQYLTYDDKILFYGISYSPVKFFELEISGYHQLSSASSSEMDIILTFYYYKASKIRIGYSLVERKDLYQSYYHQFFVELRFMF